MTETIRLPSGEEFQFPPGVPDEEKARAIDQYLAEQNSRSVGDKVWNDAVVPVASEVNRRVEELGTGIQKGAAGTLGLPKLANDALNYALQQGGSIGQRLRGREPEPVKFGEGGPFRSVAPSAQQIENFMFKTLPEATGTSNPERLPTDMAGRVLSSTGKMIGSAPVPAMTGANVAGGVGGGLLSHYFPDAWWSEPLGQMAGAGAFLGAQMLRSTPQKLAANATKDLTPDDWAKAQALQQRGQQAGVPLTANEAIASSSSHPVSGLAGDVRASQRGGAIMEKFFQDRLPAIKNAANEQIAKVGDKVDDAAAVGIRAQKAAGEAIEATRIERANAARPFFKRAESVTLPQNVTDDIINQIDSALATANPEGPIVKVLGKAKKMTVAANGNVKQLDEIVKVYDDFLKTGAFEGQTIDKSTRASVKPVIKYVKDTLKNSVDDYARGMEISGGRADLGPSIYTTQVNRAVESPLTPLADSTPGLAVNKRFESTVLAADNARPEAIKFTIRAMAAQDPNAATQAVRLHLENALNEAFKLNAGGVSPASGAKFSIMVGGTEQQRANLFAALDALPVNGKAVTGRSAGFKNLLEILERTGNTPGIGSPTAGRGVTNEMLASGGAVNAAIDSVNIMKAGPLGRISRWWKDLQMGQGYEELAKILTDKDSVAKLQELAVLKPSSDRAKLLAAELLAGNRAAQELTDQ